MMKKYSPIEIIEMLQRSCPPDELAPVVHAVPRFASEMNTFLDRWIWEAFEALHGDDYDMNTCNVFVCDDGWYVMCKGEKVAKARLAGLDDFKEDPYDSILFRFDEAT